MVGKFNTKNEKSITDILSKAFNRLKKENQLTSMRGIAHRMQVSPSYLSKVMRGEKPLTLNLIPKLQKTFHLDLIETELLQRAVLESIENKKLTPITGLKSLDLKPSNIGTYNTYTKKDFLLLQKWYYIPILNLTTITDFKSDISWISHKIGISVKETEIAVKTLIQHGYLKNNDGVLSVSNIKSRFPTDKSHESIRKYHELMMNKAIQELNEKTDQTSFDNRLINSISFAGDSKKNKQAQGILNQAIYEIAELMSQSNPDQVFQLNLQFFKVTK